MLALADDGASVLFEAAGGGNPDLHLPPAGIWRKWKHT